MFIILSDMTLSRALPITKINGTGRWLLISVFLPFLCSGFHVSGYFLSLKHWLKMFAEQVTTYQVWTNCFELINFFKDHNNSEKFLVRSVHRWQWRQCLFEIWDGHFVREVTREDLNLLSGFKSLDRWSCFIFFFLKIFHHCYLPIWRFLSLPFSLRSHS